MGALRHIISSTILTVCLSVLCYGKLSAAESDLEFDREVWDFGLIEEVDGPVSHTFTFTNNGESAIVIERVEVSCGCTTPEFSRTPVMPGKKGEIKITYDPTDRPGVFVKDVYILSGKGRNHDKVTVKGEVKPRPRTVEEDYPYVLGGGMRLSKFDANFSYVEKSKPVSMTVGYVNTSSKPVKFDFAVTPPSDYMKVTALPTICAGCRGEITITYDMRGTDIYGRIANKVVLWVNGRQETLGITTSAIVVDRFSMEYTDQGPRMKLKPAYLDLGEINAGELQTVEFSLVNEGTEPLIIRAVQPRKDMEADLNPGVTVAPGDEVKVTLSVRPEGDPGAFFADGLYITTNDPVFPMKEFRLMGKIK